MLRKELNTPEYNEFYGRYINKVDDELELISGYIEDKKYIIDFFSEIPEDKFEYRYQPKKWSIKEVLQHIIDNERIFTIRLLRIARNDKTSLPGYDQDQLLEDSGAHQKTKQQLIDEFVLTRDFTLSIIKSISDNNFKHIGTVSESKISARACAFLTIGHGAWHMNVIKEKYLK